MKETTSLVTGKDPQNKGTTCIWKLKTVAIGIFALFAACLVLSSPTATPAPATATTESRVPVQVQDTSKQPEVFELSLEQKLELWDHWKGFLALKDIWSQAQDEWEKARDKAAEEWKKIRGKTKEDWQDQAEDTWNQAHDGAGDAWKQAQDTWNQTNFTELMDPDNIQNHTQIWANQTMEQGQDWWDHANDYFNNLTEEVIQFGWLYQPHDYKNQYHKKKKRYQRRGELIYMNHSFAFYLLLSDGGYTHSMDYFQLNQGLDAQINQAYCAVATSMAVLNSLRGLIDLPQDKVYVPYPYATQLDAFNECTDANVIVHNDTFQGIFSAPGGLNLDSTQKLLQCHLPTDEWNVEAVHVDASLTVSAMRVAMIDALNNPTSRLMINYHRAIAGQVGGGHFSPIGAYSPKMDAFLIMDVAKYKYAPVWIPTVTLYQSLFGTDGCGHWKGPAAQTALTSELLHPQSMEDLAAAMALLDCQPAPRGYIIVSKK